MILSLDSYFVFDGLLHTIFSSSSLLSMLFIRILLGAIFLAVFFSCRSNKKHQLFHALVVSFLWLCLELECDFGIAGKNCVSFAS